jgi:hypothetical protein
MIATLLRTAQRYRDCGGRCDGCSCCADQDATAIGATATFTLAGDAHTDPAVLGVKGSRVQISLARRHDGGFTPLSAIHVSAVCRTQPLRKGASSRSLPRGPRGGLGRREPPHPRCQLLERACGGAAAEGGGGLGGPFGNGDDSCRNEGGDTFGPCIPSARPASSASSASIFRPHVAAESGQPPTTSRSIDVLRSVAGI